MRGFVTAFRTLSSIPLPGKDAEEFSDALVWFPVVGLVLGSLVVVVAKLMVLIFGVHWPEGIAILCVSLTVFLTRGFHLDGIADWADGFWAGYTPEKILMIMKDSFLGTFGVVALILVLVTKWIAITKLLEIDRVEWIIAAFIISRTLQVEQAVCLPYARAEGTAGPFLKNAGQRHRWIAHLLALAMLIFLFNISGVIYWLICAMAIKGLAPGA